MITRNQMPPEIAAIAVWARFGGNPIAGEPYRYGWIVDVRNTQIAYGHPLCGWLKQHGFTHRGSRWLLTDWSNPAYEQRDEPKM